MGVLNSLRVNEFATFAETHFQHTIMTKGSVLWVPYGYQCNHITSASAEHSYVLYQPFINGAIAMKYKQYKEVMQWNLNWLNAQLAMPKNIWKVHGPPPQCMVAFNDGRR